MTVVMTLIAILVAKEALDKQKKRNMEFDATLKTKSLPENNTKWRPYNSSECFSIAPLPAYKDPDFNKAGYVVSDKSYMSKKADKPTKQFDFHRDTHEHDMPKYVPNLPGDPSYDSSLPEGSLVQDWRPSRF